MSLRANIIAARGPLASFAVMGVMWGMIAADLPDLKDQLGVAEAQLGLLLFPTPVSAVAAMVLAPMAARLGGNAALPGATMLMALAFALPGQAASVWTFALAMMACGATTGLTDVLMNARVAAIETARGRSVMNLCFAAYSFGYAGGALGTGALRSMGWPPSQVLASLAALAAIAGLMSTERGGAITGLERPQGAAAARLGWVPVIGGAMVFIAFLTENASENWSALYIEQTLGGSPAQGAAGPALMALTMGVARLFGQGFANRVRPARLLAGGAVISSAGLVLAAGATGPGMAYAGFFIAGIGASVISPTAFSMVGALARPEARARAVARATMIGYLGYFVGPPAFGLMAGEVGLRATFALAAVLLAMILILAPALARQEG
ncbi:MAG: MFS transporter [Paracoccaceae bacterium]